jgi:hypothetical protein
VDTPPGAGAEIRFSLPAYTDDAAEAVDAADHET